MEARGLAIGDWVFFNAPYESIKESRVARVTGLLEDCIAIDAGGRGVTNECYYSPVPLTSEMLKMNGFALKGEGVTRKVLRNDYGSNTSIVYIIKNERINIYRDNHKVVNLKVYYVHEFQHILRACGLNDIADNIKIQ